MTAIDLSGLNNGQREGLRLLADDLELRRDLSERAKDDLIRDRLATYHERNDERRSKRKPRLPDAPKPPGRYSLLCIDCSWDLRPDSAKPRVPLCGNCKRRRQAEKRRAKEARREP